MYVYVYFYPTWDSDPNRLSCFSWGLKAGTKGKWPCAVQAVPFLVAVLASWFKKQRKIRDSLDKIPCTHQPRLNKLLLEVGRPASRSLLRVHSSCGCSPCSRDLCGVAEFPLRHQRPSRAALTHGWWWLMIVGLVGLYLLRWETLARN